MYFFPFSHLCLYYSKYAIELLCYVKYLENWLFVKINTMFKNVSKDHTYVPFFYHNVNNFKICL